MEEVPLSDRTLAWLEDLLSHRSPILRLRREAILAPICLLLAAPLALGQTVTNVRPDLQVCNSSMALADLDGDGYNDLVFVAFHCTANCTAAGNGCPAPSCSP